MSKRMDLITPLKEHLISSYEGREYELLHLDLAYASMDLSILRFTREYDEGVEGNMNEARKEIGTKHSYGCPNSFEKGKAWRRCAKDYNSLARFYRNQGLNVESIVTIDDRLPSSTLKERLTGLLLKRILREGKKIEERRLGLSN